MKFGLVALSIITFLLLSNPEVISGHGKDGSLSDGQDQIKLQIKDDDEQNHIRMNLKGNEANVDMVSMLNDLNLSDSIDSFKLKIKNDDSNIKIDVKEKENEQEEDQEEDSEIENGKFEIKGEVTATGSGTITVGGKTIVINGSEVFDFEQKGTAEIGETVKIEGIVKADGTLLAREIKADEGNNEEAINNKAKTKVKLDLEGKEIRGLLEQIIALLQNLLAGIN